MPLYAQNFRYSSGRLAAEAEVNVLSAGGVLLETVVTDSLGRAVVDLDFGEYIWEFQGYETPFEIVKAEQGERGFRPTLTRQGDRILVSYPDGAEGVDLGDFKGRIGDQGPRGYRPLLSRSGDNLLVEYEDGEDGANLGSFKGDQGPSGTLSIDQVTTRPSGQGSVITQKGTPEARVLDIALEAGQQGPAGLGAPPSGYPVLATNLLPNPSAEGAGGWLTNNAARYAHTFDTTIKRSGTRSIRVTRPAGATADSFLSSNYAVGSSSVAAGGTSSSAFQPAAELRTYTAGVWVRQGQDGYQGQIQVYCRNAANATTGTLSCPLIPLVTGEWVLVSGTFTTPVGTSQVSLASQVRTLAGSAVDEHYVNLDDAIMVEGTILPAWFSGDTPGARWAGTPNSSASELVVPRRSDVVTFGDSFDLRGVGSPLNRVYALPGVHYVDEAGTNGAWRWLSTAAGTGGWVVVEGDTGWRDVTALVSPGTLDSANAGTVSVRRTQAGVTWRFIAVTLAAGSGSIALYTVPPGFRVSYFTPFTLSRVNNAGQWQNMVTWSSQLSWLGEHTASNMANGTSVHPSVSIQGISPLTPSDEAWPTTLPGVAA